MALFVIVMTNLAVKLFLYYCILKDMSTIFSQGHSNLNNFLVLLMGATPVLKIYLELKYELLENI